MAKGQIEQIVEHQHLAVAIRSGADADGGSVDLGRDHGGDFARDAFEIHAGHAGAVERDSIAHELFDAAERLALHLVAAHHVDRLRGEADVPGDRNFGVDDAADQVDAFFPAFDLDDFGAGFFHEAGGVAHRVFRARRDKNRKACRP